MNLRTSANRRNAAISGLFTGFGMPALDTWQKAMHISPEIANVQFIVALFIFFFAPTLLFVVGVENISFKFTDILLFRRPYWSEMKEFALRGISWFAGGGFAFAVLAIIHSQLK